MDYWTELSRLHSFSQLYLNLGKLSMIGMIESIQNFFVVVSILETQEECNK